MQPTVPRSKYTQPQGQAMSGAVYLLQGEWGILHAKYGMMWQ